jgi:hypothetical protein
MWYHRKTIDADLYQSAIYIFDRFFDINSFFLRLEILRLEAPIDSFILLAAWLIWLASYLMSVAD